MYKVVRFFASGKKSQTLAEGLTLEEARERSSGPESSSDTAKAGRRITKAHGPWFIGYLKGQ